MTVSRMSGATVVEPMTTRDTVARDTPARRATFSSVGRARAVDMASPSLARRRRPCDTVGKRYPARSRPRRAARGDDPPVPVRALLQGAPLGRVVHVDDA